MQMTFTVGIIEGFKKGLFSLKSDEFQEQSRHENMRND